MISLYEQILENEPEKVAEPTNNYYCITERHVQVMWLNQKYFSPLQTTDGLSIEVISPGIWNAEAGPDFRKAHLKIGGKDVWGDVEIHLRDNGWYQHRHHHDPLYNHVVLHISFWKSIRPKTIINEQGASIIQSYFEEALTIPEKRIIQLIDLDLYPYKKFCGSGHCADKLFNKIPEKQIKSFLRDASLWRLEKKRKHLYARVEDPRLFFCAGIAMGLGYKDNAEAFLELFQKLVLHKKLSEETLLALALHHSGFFSDHFLKKWEASAYYHQLQEQEITEGILPSEQITLRLHQIRPVNHPLRRLAYLVKMIKDPSYPQLYQRMEAHWHASWPLLITEKDLLHHLEELCEMIPTYTDDYWNHHYTFESEPQEKYLPLIGQSLKTEMFVNTFLPLLYTSISTRNVTQEIDTFSKLYASVKGQPTRKAKYLQHRFFGETSKLSIFNKADIIQGAYQVHHDFCVHYEASCEGCPFIKRYSEAYASSV
jgi:Protein of unknown function (DUF2851)